MIYNNVFFVASTLPLNFILENHQNKKTLIIIKNHEIYKPYQFLKKEKKNIELKLLSKSFVFRLLNIFFLFIYYKFKNLKFIFFHECCWLEFDILIKLINPTSNYVPIVSMKGFKKIARIKLGKNFKNFFRFLFFNIFFRNVFIIFYRNIRNDYTYYYSIKRYPQNVKIIKNSLNTKSKRPISKKILLLVGKEFCDEKEIISIYKSIIIMLKKKTLSSIL